MTRGISSVELVQEVLDFQLILNQNNFKSIELQSEFLHTNCRETFSNLKNNLWTIFEFSILIPKPLAGHIQHSHKEKTALILGWCFG